MLSHISPSACGVGAVSWLFVRLGWIGRKRAVRVAHCMSAAGLTEVDEMVFFIPS